MPAVKVGGEARRGRRDWGRQRVGRVLGGRGGGGGGGGGGGRRGGGA
jgi:hypothetical protein